MLPHLLDRWKNEDVESADMKKNPSNKENKDGRVGTTPPALAHQPKEL
ncbi:11768_t:CDS:2 [Paraglomus brasilianum]|uniref:11768_t:CDS:1 n=1 Tax=Paraglomus brasilianum TaxID=144538 RepID=A0A9N9BYF1_9GLOM|nr:11768_t:CDS:2 [Paraglomus brasilianum]